MEASLLPLHVQILGRVPYTDVWELQKKLQRDLIDGVASPTLLLCEHNPVVTLGKSSNPGNILLSADDLRQRGVELHAIERGGDVTYHGPGQLVGYPIINLSHLKRDVGWYMRQLEEVLIRVMAGHGLSGRRVPGRTGVWTLPGDDDSVSSHQKIASIGVRLSRWCTMHGFAINVRNCTKGFSLIHPCGFTDVSMTSIEQELTASGRPAVLDEQFLWSFAEQTAQQFCDVFGFSRSVNDANKCTSWIKDRQDCQSQDQQ